jgi:general stress protein 26
MEESGPQYLKIMSYIDDHPIGVVSTINEDGTLHAATVYIFTASHHTVCFITRNKTRKYQNIISRPNIALTIFDQHEVSTLQAAGKAFTATDEHMLDMFKQQMEKMQAMRADAMPPIEKLTQSGEFVLVGIELQQARLAEYQGMGISPDATFTELFVDK